MYQNDKTGKRDLVVTSVSSCKNALIKLMREETAKLAKLDAIDDKLKRGENEQNDQLQTCLTEEEYA